jgi:hypothetical protein
MPITTRQELKDYCLRRLGFPVIEINVDEDQVEDRIQDALEFWNEYHFDGVEKIYLKAQVIASTLKIQGMGAGLFTVGEIITGATSGATSAIYEIVGLNQFKLKGTNGTFANGEVITGATSGVSVTTHPSTAFTLGNWDTQYFDISDAVTGVTRVFSIGPANVGSSPRNIFDVVYQFRLTDLYDLMSSDLIYYSQVKTHLQMLEMLLPGERNIRFNRKMNRLYIDVNWLETFIPENYIVAECHRILDPNQFSEVYNDMFLKRYATTLIKRQWGENMKKFGGIQLPGGVILNGKEIYDEAVTEIVKIEEEMQSRYELPADFMVG